jgi:GT2 family glycosyltransferase
MSSPPAIRAVMVNYNAGAWLRRAVNSVLESTRPVELVVIDNQSTDDSLACLSDLETAGRVELVRNASNRGYASACNQALEDNSADFYLLINPDCELEPETIGRLLATLEAQPDAGVVGALVLNPDGSEQRACRRREPTPARSVITMLGLESFLPGDGVNIRGPLPESWLELEAVSGALLLVRGSLMRQLGGLDEDYFLHCEDLDLFHRIRAAGFSVLFEPRARVRHAKGVSQLSRPLASEWHKHAGMVRYYRKHLASESFQLLQWLWPMLIWTHFALLSPILWLRSRGRR